MEPIAKRVKRLQKLAAELGLDGLLFVSGPDSKFSVGCAQAIGYALQGRSNRAVVEATQEGTQSDDLVLLIQPGGVSCYVPGPEAAATVLESLQCFAPQIFRPTAKERDNPDIIDDVKLAAFVQMLRGTKRLGIPVGLPREGEAPPVSGTPVAPRVEGSQLMQLEQWPLIQAYGLEGVGRDGFFTQAFEVYDVYACMQECFAALDGPALECVLHENLHQLKQHWGEVLKGVSSQAPSAQCSLTERQVLEPLQGWFQYGMVRATPGVAKDVTMPPRAVFGPRTNDETSVSDSYSMTTAQKGATPACHWVLEAADPRSPLRVGRTYFMSRGSVCRDTFADPRDEAIDGFSYESVTSGYDPSPAHTLMRVYTALGQAAYASMEHFATTEGATVQSARSIVLDVLSSRCAALGVPQPSVSTQLRMDLWQCDHANRVQRVAVRGSPQLKVLRVALTDIHHKGVGGESTLLGAVTYADTFLEVLDGTKLLVLTSDIPALVSWPAVGCETVLAQRTAASFKTVLDTATAARTGVGAVPGVKATVHKAEAQREKAIASLRKAARVSRGGGADDTQARDASGDGEGETEQDNTHTDEETTKVGAYWPDPLQSLGQLLTLGGGDDAVLLTGCSVCPSESGSVYCFARGLVFASHSTRSLWVLDFLSELEAVSVQPLNNPKTGADTDPGVVCEAVVFRGKRAVCGFAPACHLTTDKHIALALTAMTPAARRHMMSVVLPAWHQTCREGALAVHGPDWTGPAEVIAYDKDPSAANPFPVSCYNAHMTAVQQAHEHGKRWPDLRHPDTFVDSVLTSMDATEWVQLGSNYPSVEQMLMCGTHPTTPHSVSVILVTGLPGAGQALTARSIVDMCGEAATVRIACVGQGGDFSAALDACLPSSDTYTSHTPGLLSHIVVTCASFAPLVQQLAGLANSNAFKQARCHLSGIITCVSPSLAWEAKERSALMPGLIGQLPLGFLDAVVVNANSINDYKQAHELLLRVLGSQCAPPVVRGGSHAMLVKARDELMPAREERQTRLARLAEQRCMAYWPPAAREAMQAAGNTSVCQPASLCGPLQSVRVVFTGAVSLDRLMGVLKRLQAFNTPAPTDKPTTTPHTSATSTTPFPLLEQRAPMPTAPTDISFDTAAAAGGGAEQLPSVAEIEKLIARAGAAGCGVLGAAGIARVALGAFPQEFVWGVGCDLRSQTSVMQDLPIYYGRPRVLESDVTCGGEVVVWGTGLPHADTWTALIAHCSASTPATPPPGVAAQQGSRTLSKQELAALSEEHRFDPLPEGYTFDGTLYYDAFGDSSPTHPCLPALVQAKLQERASAEAAAQAEWSAQAEKAAQAAARVSRVTLNTLTR